jgi:tetratricopeptide (TPR) repeat protein
MTPQEAFAFSRPGFKAYSEGRIDDGEAVADSILMVLPHDANGLYLKGICRRAKSDFATAITHLEQANKAVPGQFGFGMAIAQCRADMEEYDTARSAYTALVAHFPNQVELLRNFAMMEKKCGNLEDADSLLDKLLKVSPGDLPALSTRAWIAENLRNWPDAITYSEQVLAKEPCEPLALSAHAAADLAAGQHSRARYRIEEYFAPSDNSAAQNMPVYQHLGMACEADGDFGAAFEAFEAGNAALREWLIEGRAFTDGLYSLPCVQRLRDIYENWGPQAIADDDVTPGPVFLVGFPRSGTTLLESVIGAHSRVTTSDERPLLEPIITEAGDTGASLSRFIESLPQTGDELRAAYWQSAAACGAVDGKVFVDKLPLNMMWLGLIAHVFPKAKILLSVRDPRDCVFSSYKQRFGLNSAMIHMLSIGDTAAYYDAVMGAGDAARKACPTLDVIDVRYEDMIGDTEGQARRVIDALGLPWEDTVMNYRDALPNHISTPSAPQVERPIYLSSMGLWRNYAEPMSAVTSILAPWVERWGYEPD